MARQLDQHFRELPDAQQFVANQRVDVFDDMVKGNRVREQFVVFFGVSQNRQHPDLMHQPAQRCLIRFKGGATAAQGVTNAGDFEALTPHITHFVFNHLGAGMEDLLHDQPDREVAAVVDTQSGDGGVQVGDLLSGAQQRAVHHFDQAR